VIDKISCWRKFLEQFSFAVRASGEPLSVSDSDRVGDEIYKKHL
jgi:hypothetical protein